MREFLVDLTSAATFEDFVRAFNEGFCQHVGGGWSGQSWDAFHDYLSWPDEEQYRLVIRGWRRCRGLTGTNRKMVREIVGENTHVVAVFE